MRTKNSRPSGDSGPQLAEQAAARHRALQEEAMSRNGTGGNGADNDDKPVQAGSRTQPENPLPGQHLDKPGSEAELKLAPRFKAPDYQGSGKLEGRVALITGGDSGIGRAVAVLYAREGADVAVVYLNEHEDAQETARHVAKEGRRCLLIPGDVSSREFCDEAVARAVAEFGRIDVLVNNAAFQQHVERIEDLSDAQIEETFRTNIFAYLYFARACVPHMGAGSAIVNCGSVTGLDGSGGLLDYSATKGAIHALTRSLAKQLLPRSIRVNAVAPGPVWTPLNPADREADDVAEFGADSGMGRPAQPEELSPAFVFLAAPCCSSYITGIVLPVTGEPD
ncbi:SDR family oxidoreductase [Pseudomarimonas salicorniae]|uniref:SDR family oxidoreductase n=1 Tax=Pseudomarimonas salicorniae TaxID=2933270 RepID=A0ABT0GLF4_9GAMM|nr:SDR family oxidoreductase [Lysobacter sp. CAU 1642]MCK7595243.1 SDR family oxidoreductase [Lysobacter sp. CAU 1642]